MAVQLPRAAVAAAPGVTLSGNQFLLAGQPFVPHGFDSIALLNSAWCTSKSTAAAASNLGSAELNAAENTWYANTLRFQVSQPVLAGPNGAAYAQQVESGADLALNAGFAVDISMQDQSLACGPAEPLPSQETETAWATLVSNTTLAGNPSVMFELFNEPQNSPASTPATDPGQETWADWLNGGRQIQPTSSQHWPAYTPVGHQDLVTYLRTTLNVTNVLIADGGDFLSGRLRVVAESTGTFYGQSMVAGDIYTIAGGGTGGLGDGGPALRAEMDAAVAVAVEPSGAVLVSTPEQVRLVSG